MRQKPIRFTILCFIILLFGISFTLSVSAFNPTSILFGSDSTDASNPDENKETIITKNIIIENTNDAEIEIFGITTTNKLGFSDNDLKIIVDIQNTVLQPGETSPATISARIPESLDAVDSNLKESSFNTADMFLTGNLNGSSSADLIGKIAILMQRENHLNIDKAKFEFGDNSENADDGDKIDNIRPGDDFTLDITVENTFRDNDDVAIDDIEVSYIVDDNELDIDENEDIGRISADDDDSETLKFDIEDDADDDTYDGILFTSGTDDYGALHGEIWDIDLKVEREDDEIAIDSLTITPDRLLCERRNIVTVASRITNIGKHDNDEISIEIENQELGIYERIDNIELDQDDSTRREFSFDIPEDTQPDQYDFIVKTYYDSSIISHQDSISLLIQGCDATTSIASKKPSEKSGEKTPYQENVEVIFTSKDKGFDTDLLGALPNSQGFAQAIPVSSRQAAQVATQPKETSRLVISSGFEDMILIALGILAAIAMIGFVVLILSTRG